MYIGKYCTNMYVSLPDSYLVEKRTVKHNCLDSCTYSTVMLSCFEFDIILWNHSLTVQDRPM